MRLDKSQIVLLGLAAPACAHPKQTIKRAKAVQPDLEKANAVKDVFQTAWKGYYENAFPHDNLHPISNTFDDDR